MAGHSKWSNIKHKKSAEDKKRAKAFGQVSKMIRVAVKEGKSEDPEFNPALRTALDKAKEVNMPKDNIQRAIDRGMGRSSSTGAPIQQIAYEGFGPGGVAVVAVAHTDNPNRTSSEVRYAFSEVGGSLGKPGCTAYLLERQKTGEYQAKMEMEVADSDTNKLRQLVDTLRENEDVEDVYTSAKLEQE